MAYIGLISNEVPIKIHFSHKIYTSSTLLSFYKAGRFISPAKLKHLLRVQPGLGVLLNRGKLH